MPRLDVLSREMKTQVIQDLYTYVNSSIIYSSQKVETIQISKSIGENWINKVLYIHKIEYYSSIKRNKLQTQATT